MTDTSIIRQVLGCLIQHPQYLSQIDKYSLTPGDFSTRFEKHIFIAVDGLYRNGVSSITAVDIVNYLETDSAAKATFEQFNGIEYVQDAVEFSNVENFDYYYTKLKKLNLLRDLKKGGIDTSEFYCEDLTDIRAQDINSQFEQLTIQQIIEKVKKKLLHLENNYSQSDEVQVQTLATGLKELFEDIHPEDELGRPVQGSIYSQIINGALKGTLTIRSGSSGLGKTRQAVGDACMLAFPTRYNQQKGQWEQVGAGDKVLFIVTEQTIKQVQRMATAYLTGINESRFKFGNFTKEEQRILDGALRVVHDYEENFVIIKCPNPTIESIKSLIRENCILHEIDHVFYDYIFIGPSLLNEFRGFNLRNDELLLMFATALKDLAVELNVTMMTSTQVNASADDNKNIRNEASLAGGRSTINKADNGAIMARPTKEELEVLEPIIEQFGEPNCVTDIFKVRSGEWTQVRIWSRVDLGTLRKEDLFLTDSRLDLIPDFHSNDLYVTQNWDDEDFQKIKEYVEQLNRKES